MKNENLRPYLENLIISQQMTGSSVEDAVEEAAKVENLCRQNPDKILDPYDEFGDPIAYGKKVAPRKSVNKLTLSMFFSFVLLLPITFSLIWALRLFGVETISKLVFTILFIGISSFLISGTIFSEVVLLKEDSDSKKRFKTSVIIYFLLIFISLSSAYYVFPEEVSLMNNSFWLTPIVGFLLLGGLVAVYKMTTRPDLVVLENYGPTTREIVEDINSAGFIKGWPKYGPSGELLR